MDKLPFWYGRVDGMTKPPVYKNYNLWSKYKKGPLNVQESHHNQKTENDVTHKRKEFSELNAHLFSFSSEGSTGNTTLRSLRCQNLGLAEWLEIEEEKKF